MLARIELSVTNDGKISISLCAGQAETRTFNTHYSELEPVPIIKDDRVYLIDDDKGYELKEGHVVKKLGKDFIVRIVPDLSKPLAGQKTLLVKKEAQLVKIEGKSFQEDWGDFF